MGVMSLALIPTDRLLHCPYLRISNVKTAHASDDIYTPRHNTPYRSIYAKIVHPLLAYTLLYI